MEQNQSPGMIYSSNQNSACQQSTYNTQSLQNSLSKVAISSLKKSNNQVIAQAFASNFKQSHDEEEQTQKTIQKLYQKCYSLREVVEKHEQNEKEMAKEIKILKEQNLNLDSRLNGVIAELKKLVTLDVEVKLIELTTKNEEIINHLRDQEESISLCNEACTDYAEFKGEFEKAIRKQKII